MKHHLSLLEKRHVNSDQNDLDKRMLGLNKPSRQEVAEKHYIKMRDKRLRERGK